MNQPTARPLLQQPAVYQPQPLAPAQSYPVAPAPQGLPGVYTITAPDGSVHHVYGPPAGAPIPLQNSPLPAAETRRSLVHPLLANLAVGAAALAGIAFGLHLLVGFITALAHLVATLVTLAAVLIGGWVLLRILAAAGTGGSNAKPGTTVNIKKAVFKRNTFRS